MQRKQSVSDSSAGCVTSAHPSASQAGTQALKRGGNAFDAIVVTSLTLSALLPAFSGIGGGGFATLHSAPSNETICLDFRERAPRRARPDMYDLVPDITGARDSRQSSAGAKDDSNRMGYLAVATPGTLAGLGALLRRFGSISLEDALATAADAASKGTPATKAAKLALDRTRVAKLSIQKYFRDTFVSPLRNAVDGSALFVNKDLVNTYRALSTSGDAVGSFYRGRLASEIAEFMESNGGLISAMDLESYSPVWRKPLSFEFLDWRFSAFPLP